MSWLRQGPPGCQNWAAKKELLKEQTLGCVMVHMRAPKLSQDLVYPSADSWAHRMDGLLALKMEFQLVCVKDDQSDLDWEFELVATLACGSDG